MHIKPIRTKIAIAGAGMAGAYLYRLLHRQGVRCDVYDVAPATLCGLSPCAWGTSRDFAELVADAGLTADDYILQRTDHVLIDDVKIKADLMTFDKPRLVKDLLAGAQVTHSGLNPTAYERVIDATGAARVFLPAIADDIVLQCVQYRLKSSQALENQINLGRIGYAWCFPLSAGRYHIGCGSLTDDPRTRIDELGLRAGSAGGRQKVICDCSGKIRLAGPQASLPFVTGEIWGVGEAIGCVAPLAGDGIVPGMKSVQLLIKHWDDPDGYTRAVLKAFRWMHGERRVLEKLRKGQPLRVQDALVLKRNSKRMGMQIKIGQAAKILRRLQGLPSEFPPAPFQF
jgi:flavin-dependent dehydrogenase